jgi:hypothetical protein
VLDILVGDLVDRLIERPLPCDESFIPLAHGPQPEESVVGFVLDFRRRCRRILMSDMPIHRIEIQRLTQAIEREPVAYLVARVAFVIPYWSGGLADRSARPRLWNPAL